MRAGGVPVQALNTHRATLADAPSEIPRWMTPQAGVIKAIIEI